MITVTIVARKGKVEDLATGDFLNEADSELFTAGMVEALTAMGATKMTITTTIAGVTIDHEDISGFVKAAAERIKRTFSKSIQP